MTEKKTEIKRPFEAIWQEELRLIIEHKFPDRPLLENWQKRTPEITCPFCERASVVSKIESLGDLERHEGQVKLFEVSPSDFADLLRTVPVSSVRSAGVGKSVLVTGGSYGSPDNPLLVTKLGEEVDQEPDVSTEERLAEIREALRESHDLGEQTKQRIKALVRRAA